MNLLAVKEHLAAGLVGTGAGWYGRSVVLPQPDSPTRPIVVPRFNVEG